MKKLAILLAILGTMQTVHAQFILSDFSNFSVQVYSPLNGTWGNNEGVNQYIQNNGNVSITTVSGTGPDGTGSFDAVFPGDNTSNSTASVDFTGVVFFSLTAELNSTNTNTEIQVLVNDSNGSLIGSADFLTAGFSTTSFTTETVPFVLALNQGVITNANYFTVAGDGVSGDVVSMSLDNLQTGVYVAPEPSTWAMMGLGLCGLIGFCLRRQRPLSV
jgi:hypothetical protein